MDKKLREKIKMMVVRFEIHVPDFWESGLSRESKELFLRMLYRLFPQAAIGLESYLGTAEMEELITGKFENLPEDVKWLVKLACHAQEASITIDVLKNRLKHIRYYE